MPIGEQIRALVVEDDTDYAFLLATLLRREGYAALIAQDGYDALKRISADQPDLIVLDLNLPLLDGCDVLAEVRAHHPETPVIVVSGAPDAKSRVLAHGATALLTKPLNVHDFLRTVSAVMAPRRTDQGVSPEQG